MKVRTIALLMAVVFTFGSITPWGVKEVKASEVTKEIEVNEVSEDDEVPEYILTESKNVAAKVEHIRNNNCFVAGFISDFHTNRYDQSAVSVKHAGMAMNEIQYLTKLDVLANFGDIPVGKFEEKEKKTFDYVKSCFSKVIEKVPYIQMQGNHDQLKTDTTEEARKKYYDYIGANNEGAVVDEDNKFRNYGYRDFEDQKKRIIYLNTSDVSDYEITNDSYVTAEQLSWVVNHALDFSDKPDAEEWTVSVYSHNPLTWHGNVTNVLTVLDAYKGKISGSLALDGKLIEFDFSDAKAKFIAHYHGHLHNFRVDKLGVYGIASITLPNVCFNRVNEYGTIESYGEYINELYGDIDIEGKQRQFLKTEDSAEDTSFNIVVEDIENEKIYCFNYGAGIDRVVDFEGNVVEPDEEDLSNHYTNQIPLSVDEEGEKFTGENGEAGYRSDYRISVSKGTETAAEGISVTGYIPVEENDNVRIKGIDITDRNSTMAMYDESFQMIKAGYCNEIFYQEDEDGIRRYRLRVEDVKYVRISGEFSEDALVTVNEEIHEYGQWTVDSPATPEEDGMKYRECALCGSRLEEVIPKVDMLTISGASLTLHDNLTINFKTKLKMYRKDGYINPYMAYTFNKHDSFARYYTVTSEGHMFDYRDIAPHQMNDKITATLYAEQNGKEYASETREYSVAMYCHNMLKNCESDSYSVFRTLLVDLLEYGAASQVYINYKTDELANKDLTEKQKGWATSEEREYESIRDLEYETIENPTVEWKGAGLYLKDRVEMRFKIAAEKNSNLNIRIITESDKEWVRVIYEKSFEPTEGGYYFHFNGLNAAQMSEPVYLTVYDGDTPVSNTICYSIESYVSDQLKKDDQDEEFVTLIKAMMNYGDSAYAFSRLD